MQEAVFEINGVKTPVLSYGRHIEENPKSFGDQEEMILLIPGNPGITGFYKMFCHTLHEKTGLPVWVVGHAGHEMSKGKQKCDLPLKGNEAVFGLQEQITHKAEFIKKFIPHDAKIHLVGHSIGCYVILELLKDESINSKIVDTELLFPTIEFMAEAPNGKFMLTFVKPIVWFIVFLSLIYTLLPSFLSNFLLVAYMKFMSIPRMHFRTLKRFINPGILEKVFFLAFQELAQVKQRNNDVIKQNIDKIRLLYGEHDSWAPGSYCNKLKNDIPGVKAEVSNYDHAFVLKQSREVGQLIAEWITKKQ